MTGQQSVRSGREPTPSHGRARPLSAPLTAPLAAFARMLCGLTLAALAGCGTLMEPVPQAARAPITVTPTAEDLRDATIGAQEHPRLVAAFGGVYVAPQMQALIEGVVARLVPASDRPDLRYQVTILDSPSVNAFALPGGYIYVTRGLLALANTEDELASVIAHEMAHVTARHAAERERRLRQAARGENLEVTLANFSQSQEIEADAIGIRLMARAGYDPSAAARFLVSMGRKAVLNAAGNRQSEDPSFLASHPSTPARVAKARDLAAELARAIPAAAAGEASDITYLTALRGVRFGSAREGSAVADTAYRDATRGIAFDAPAGFTLDASAPGTVYGAGARDDALRFDTVAAEGAGTPVAVISDGWIEGAEVTEVRPLIVDGLSGATGLARVGEWTFRLGAIRYGDKIYRFVLGARVFSTSKDRAFTDTIRSFRRLKGGERDVRPTRIALHRVGSGDTVSRLARRMEVSGDASGQFLVLNGLAPGDPLTPGRTVKLVRR